MQIEEQIHIPAPREKVFAALNDPAILQQSIPGCETLEKVGDNAFKATVVAKVGPVKATFKGGVTLSDLNPPESYTISGEGKAGPAGFARGDAKVRLTEDGGGTLLAYEVDAKVGGKLAQVGNRLIEATTKKVAGQFFSNFEDLVGEPTAAPTEVAAADEAASGRRGLNPVVWVVGAVIVLGVLIWLVTAG